MPPKPETGEVGAGWKLGWIEGVAFDPDITGRTLSVAVAISSRTGRNGVARTASQGWLAKRLDTSERVIRDCIGRLIKRGHLMVAKSSSGRGRATEYRLAKGIGAEPETRTFSTEKTRTFSTEKADNSGQLDDAKSPPLPLSFQEYFQRRTRARAPNGDNTKPDDSWRPMKEQLAASVGHAKVQAWLEPLSVCSIVDGEMTLVAPSRFVARHVENEFGDEILKAWRELGGRALRIDVARPGKSTEAPAHQGASNQGTGQS